MPNQKIMVKSIASNFLFLLNNTEIRCPKIIPVKDISNTWIELFGVFSKTSTQNSNIFCAMAVEIARNVPIGTNSRMYFLAILRMLGNMCFSFLENGSVLECVS